MNSVANCEVASVGCMTIPAEIGENALESIFTLEEGRLFALQNVLELDGRISSYPADSCGYSVSNCYVLKEGKRAVLLDTGFASHEGAILAQLRSVLGEGVSLSVFPLRINEFMSVNNVEAIAARFDMEQCYFSVPDAEGWLNFGATSDDANRRPISTTIVARAQTLHVGLKGDRPLEAFQAPIRLIGTRWIYDGLTKTLFTSDSFSWEWRQHAQGPWIVSESSSTAAHVRSFLLNTRYWWLEGGNTSALRQKLAAVFEKYDIHTIAPGYGRILRGRDIVEQQYQLLDDVLRDLDKSVVSPRYIDRDELR